MRPNPTRPTQQPTPEPADPAASPASQPDLLLVVRHADAGDKRRWEGLDLLRPLSPLGRCQADGLVFRLEDYPIERILCSPTLRCLETVQPLARDRYLRVEAVEELGVGADPARLLARFRDGTLHGAVLCTHGETIARLLGELDADGLAVERPLIWPKGSTWLLQRTEHRRPQIRGRLLAPLALNRITSSILSPSDRLEPVGG